MSLFVEKTMEIHASAAAVWDAFLNHTDQWASEFTQGNPELHIESDWNMGSPVLWKTKEGKIIVEGTVTGLVPGEMIRFTAFDASVERPVITEEDGIMIVVAEGDCHTVFGVRHGDFSCLKDGEQHRDASEKIWDRVLDTVSFLAQRH
jgi:uncharacterized protein YndB with AHSA1/START domain